MASTPPQYLLRNYPKLRYDVGIVPNGIRALSLVVITLILMVASLGLSTSSALAFDCCKCGLEMGANGCTISNSACNYLCPTSTPKPAPLTATPLPPGVPTNTPPPGSTATPVPSGAPTPTEGACNTTCDVDCTANATAPVWSSWGWPASPLR